MVSRGFLAGVAALGFLLSAQDLRSPLYINLDLLKGDPRSATVSYQPAFARGGDGPLTFVWTAYRNGREKILSATIRGARPSPERQLSPGEGVYYSPAIAATGPDSGWVFWMRLAGRRWEIAGRRSADGSWLPVEILSGTAADALRPATFAADGRVFAAWEEDDGKARRIVTRRWEGNGWSPPAPVSDSGADSFRPALAAGGDGSVWAVWDSYRDSEYAVFGRRIYPESGELERISSGDRSCLKPAVMYGSKAGLVVAWLARRDVTGARGVLDQWYTLQAAVRRNGRWEALRDPDTGADVADLRHSLLPVIEPQVIGLYGYQGRRLHPMLVEEDGAIWLLWERRIVHDGRGDTAGELCGRRFAGESWSRPVSLHQGLLDYRVPSDGKAQNGRVTIAAKGLHQYYMAMEIDLAHGRPIEFANLWNGWKPVRLPLHDAAPRGGVEIDGRKHNLYWADLHAHSGLTADAEGEVDELLHFARDKARLDVVVMQENDFIGRMLTEGEYRLSVYSSRRISEPGRFLALPGFEWTHRGDERNHRTIMYPGEETPIVRHPENGGNFEELCDAVEAAGGVMNTQHETFRLSRRPCDANMEVASGWRVFIKDPDKIHRELSAGHRVGFVATSDGHRRNPGTGGGLTGIYAPELTPQSIVDAIRDHRLYATNGTRVVIDARANGTFMGSDVQGAAEVRLTLKVRSPKPVMRAVLVRDGDEIHSATAGGAASMDIEHNDRPARGYHWYYWRIELQGESPDYPANIKVAEGNLAWTSPHRVTVR